MPREKAHTRAPTCESTSWRFQQGDGPSRGLLWKLWNFAKVRWRHSAPHSGNTAQRTLHCNSTTSCLYFALLTSLWLGWYRVKTKCIKCIRSFHWKWSMCTKEQITSQFVSGVVPSTKYDLYCLPVSQLHIIKVDQLGKESFHSFDK